jgi:hypothetical protein
VTHSLTRKLGVCSLAAVLTVMTGATGFAAERPAAAPARPTLLVQAQKQVQQIAKVTTPAVARSSQEGQAGGYDAPATFFKTKRGVALLVLAAAGIGYMTYSAFDDRIHSQARERLDN